MKELFGTPFKDLYTLTEDERIDEIGKHIKSGKTVAFLVDDEEEKVNRYIKKLEERYDAIVVGKAKGPVKNVITINVRSKLAN